MPFSSDTRICQAGLKVNFFKQFIIEFIKDIIIVDVSDVFSAFNFLYIVEVAEVLKVVIDDKISTVKPVLTTTSE
jgi:hypothetical protein